MDIDASIEVENAFGRVRTLLEIAGLALDSKESPLTSEGAAGFQLLSQDAVTSLTAALKKAGLMRPMP